MELNWLQPEVGTEITAVLSDLDGDTTGITWSWYRSKVASPNRSPGSAVTDLAAEWELIGTATGEDYEPQGRTAGTTEDAVDETWFLLARAEYMDPEATGKATVGISAYAVRADVSDADNNSPDFNQNTTTRTVPENTAVGSDVGDEVDVDQNEDRDTLTYELDNDNDITTLVNTSGDVGFFSIDKATGQVKVAKKLDWDNNPEQPDNPDGKYVFWVRATDPSGETTNDENSDAIQVTVTATNVNDAPRISDGAPEISINEVNSSKKDTDVTKFVGLGYELTDADPPEMQFDPTNPNLYHRSDEDRVDRGIWPEPLAGPDGRLFEYSIPDDGIGRRLHFKKANLPDYENPMDANRDNVYEVTVVVRDNGNASGMKNVRITVMNVDEAGKLVLSPEQPDSGMPVMATLTDPDGVEYITDWKWVEIGTRVDEFPAGMVVVAGATTDQYSGKVGSFVWAMVDYRDGYSMEDDPVTALDERNDNPGTADNTEQHKYQNMTDDDPPVEDSSDRLFHNSDQMLATGADNAVQKDPDEDDDIPLPSTDPVLVDLMVYENVPSTGYVGIPLARSGEMGLQYKDTAGATQQRDTIGGPDGASFVFAENYDKEDQDFYDMVMTDSDNITVTDPDANPPIVVRDDPDDKMGQLAAAVVTHFDAEAAKNSYIIEITDPDAEVAVGPVRVTITVVNVNEAPSAPSVRRGDTTTPTNNAPEFPATEDGARNVAENTPTDTAIGDPVEATDADADDTLTYTLGGTDMASFDIGETTGQLMTKTALDYEDPMDADTDNAYEVTVTASDGTGEAMVAVTITVTNVGLDDSYDANDDGVIDEDEVIKAVNDYFDDVIGDDRVIDIVNRYFES